MQQNENENENKPTWFKLWVSHLDVFAEDDGTINFEDIGIAVYNALIYLDSHNEENLHKMDKGQKYMFKMLKKDVEQAYKDYEMRVNNGRKGGRPRKKQEPAADCNSYGEFKTVQLSDAEYQKLCEKYNAQIVNEYISRVDREQSGKGKSYNNHYAIICQWIEKDTKPDNKKRSINDYQQTDYSDDLKIIEDLYNDF